jgi:hypothetical protein
LSFLPSFLDEKAISYLFNYSTKDLEFATIKKKMDDIHLIMRAKREKKLEEFEFKKKKEAEGRYTLEIENIYDKEPSKNVFKTSIENDFDENNLLDDNAELNKNLIKYLLDKYKKNSENFNSMTLKNFKSINANNKAYLAEDEIEYIKSVQNLESQLVELQNFMLKMKKAEMERINKEFYTNDYERRYNITLEGMISAIVGEDNVLNEIGKQKRDAEAYFKKLEGLRSFNVMSELNKFRKTGIYKFP